MKYSYLSKQILVLLFVLILCTRIQAQYADNSVLTTGSWYKLGITNSGIYKIDANFLRNLGIDPQTINPKHIQIYGNGGGMLPQINTTIISDDLTENAIWVKGEEDGIFNENDYVLFYAEGADSWQYEEQTQLFEHQKNLYADINYYFLTIQDASGLRVAEQSQIDNATTTITLFDDYVFHEQDHENIVKSGREWYGEVFGTIKEMNFDFDLTGIQTNTPLNITTAVMSRDTQASSFQVFLQGISLGSLEVENVGTGTYDRKGNEANTTFTTNSASLSGNTQAQLTLQYIQSKPSSRGYLNYIRINYQRTLKLYANQTSFRSLASTSHQVSNFVIDDVSGTPQLWNVTNPLRPVQQQYTQNGTQISFSTNTESLKEFIIFQGNEFETPASGEKISNQNLHSLSVPDLVIVTPPVFLEQAQRLAEFRQSHDRLAVEVVTTEEVYNEFSSGRQDISALRNFVKMLYEKNSTALKYLLLFGDASYDYKDRVSNNTNFVPVYESYESLHPIFSYSSDDYYGFLENGEGEWEETSQGDHTLEIGIGRLPVKTVEEATLIVNKLIHYSSNANTLGSWRNKVCFVADDGDSNIHQTDANTLAEEVEEKFKEFNPEKLFLDAFEQVPTANGELSQALKDKINEEVERGVLILNYTGHGGEIGWTEEKILDITQIKDWRNIDNLPLFVTATCEFGRYDDPFQVTGAEEVILHPGGGGIALLTTTRPVFASTNFALNDAFYKTVFTPIDGEMPRLGDIARFTKNNSLKGSVNRNFSLLGDPSQRLAYPTYNVVITKINDLDALHTTDITLKALEIGEIEGEIRNNAGTLQNDFEGVAEITVFDKRETRSTFGTAASVMDFDVRDNILFRGKASITGGKFRVQFPIPKDINYTLGQGKISIYAQNTSGTLDAQGGYANLLIGGSADKITTDTTPPQIQLWMDDKNFISGNTVDSEALLIAYLKDDQGINISGSGIGHEITAILDKDESTKTNLNTYYQANVDTYQEGTVLYPYESLEEGKHTLTFKAWDVYNNSATSQIEFIVANDPVIALQEVLNYPNPLLDFTTFSFVHDKEGKNLEVRIDIYDASGRLIHTLEQNSLEFSSKYQIAWDGLDSQGNRLKGGVYVYKLTVFSPDDYSSNNIRKKLVVIN